MHKVFLEAKAVTVEDRQSWGPRLGTDLLWRRFCLLNMETSHDQEIKVSLGPHALGLFSLR